MELMFSSKKRDFIEPSCVRIEDIMTRGKDSLKLNLRLSCRVSDVMIFNCFVSLSLATYVRKVFCQMRLTSTHTYNSNYIDSLILKQ
jgi:hypothetical protein